MCAGGRTCPTGTAAGSPSARPATGARRRRVPAGRADPRCRGPAGRRCSPRSGARGYYTRTTLVAYDWNGRELKERWFVDSGHAPMANPFNASPHGVDGSNPAFATL
ncbi:rhamnogalacturonan lyase, partial [Streptosporangium sp. NPDC002721]